MRPHSAFLTASLIAGFIALPVLALGLPASGTAPATSVVTRAVERLTGPPSADRLRDLRDRASAIIGASVYNDQGEAIGKVDDLLLRVPGTGPTVVISVGGFLGMGDRLVTMPFTELQFGGAEGRWTLAGATKDSLTARTSFHYDGRR